MSASVRLPNIWIYWMLQAGRKWRPFPEGLPDWVRSKWHRIWLQNRIMTGRTWCLVRHWCKTMRFLWREEVNIPPTIIVWGIRIRTAWWKARTTSVTRCRANRISRRVFSRLGQMSCWLMIKAILYIRSLEGEWSDIRCRLFRHGNNMMKTGQVDMVACTETLWIWLIR